MTIILILIFLKILGENDSEDEEKKEEGEEEIEEITYSKLFLDSYLICNNVSLLIVEYFFFHYSLTIKFVVLFSLYFNVKFLLKKTWKNKKKAGSMTTHLIRT